MNEQLKKRIAKEHQDEKLGQLMSRCVNLIKSSRTKMSKLHTEWDYRLEVFEGKRTSDREDLKARKDREPEKGVLSLTKAQTMTFVTFCFLLLMQQKKFFMLEGKGQEDQNYREAAEQLMQRDLTESLWGSVLFQWLLDLGRFGLAVIKDSWVTKTQWVPVVTQPQTTASKGFNVITEAGGETQFKEVVKFQGTEVMNLSPYNFFPDPSVPLSDWRKGKFAGDENEVNKMSLVEMERQGLVAGIDYVDQMENVDFQARSHTRLPNLQKQIEAGANKDDNNFLVALTTVQLEIIPNDFGLGPEQHYQKWEIWIANDKRIVRAVPMGYIHDQWTYNVGMFTPDQHIELIDSLADNTAALQDVASFFFNSRLIAIRNSLHNKLVIDKTAVEMSSLSSKKPYIFVNKSAARLGVDKFVHQLPFSDSTVNHVGDVQNVMQIMQSLTGISDNLMGQISKGRRSSFEAQAVNNGAASRLKVLVAVIWTTTFVPLGRKMVTNSRQGLSFEQFAKEIGQTEKVQELYAQYHPQQAEMLVGNSDFFIRDATMQSERIFIAQTLQELLVAIISNPAAALQLNLSPQKLLEDIQFLRGVEDFDRYKLTNADPEELQTILGGLVQGGPTQPQGGTPVAG